VGRGGGVGDLGKGRGRGKGAALDGWNRAAKYLRPALLLTAS